VVGDTMRGNRRLLLVGTPSFVAAAILLALLLGRLLDSLTAVLVLFLLYWSGACILATLGAPRAELAALYRTRLNRRPLEFTITWLPALATFLIVLLPSASRVPPLVWPAILVFGVVNGFVEELFWRGAFVASFPDDLLLAYLYPSGMFALWHVALALLPGLHYPGGVAALVGGSTVLGLGWGWVVWRTRDLRSVSGAHAVTNVFAFVGPVLLSWALK
jgi:uncharacterized protein